jgi:hypothetical protein
MTDTFSAPDLIVGRRIRDLAEAGSWDRSPDDVLGHARAASSARRLFRIAPVAAAVVILLGAVVAAGVYLGQTGLSVASARVDNLTYTTAVARTIHLSGVRLTPIGEVTQNTSGFPTEGTTAYKVDDVDPQQILVMKLVPGQHDDAGSIGDYLVLVRGNGFSLLCPYFAPADPLAPSVCEGKGISRERAIELALTTAPADATAFSAERGPLSDFVGTGVSTLEPPDLMVWAIVLHGTFSGICVINASGDSVCPPDATSQLVVIDGHSGAFLYSEAPAP